MEAANTFLPSIAEGVQWVREREKFAFISEGLTLRHAAKKPPCNLKTGNYFTFVEKNSLSVNLETLVLIELHECM